MVSQTASYGKRVPREYLGYYLPQYLPEYDQAGRSGKRVPQSIYTPGVTYLGTYSSMTKQPCTVNVYPVKFLGCFLPQYLPEYDQAARSGKRVAQSRYTPGSTYLGTYSSMTKQPRMVNVYPVKYLGYYLGTYPSMTKRPGLVNGCSAAYILQQNTPFE